MRSEQLFEIETSPLVHITSTGLRNNPASTKKITKSEFRKWKIRSLYIRLRYKRYFVSIKIFYNLSLRISGWPTKWITSVCHAPRSMISQWKYLRIAVKPSFLQLPIISGQLIKNKKNTIKMKTPIFFLLISVNL
jgi:hypothetical protein